MAERNNSNMLLAAMVLTVLIVCTAGGSTSSSKRSSTRYATKVTPTSRWPVSVFLAIASGSRSNSRRRYHHCSAVYSDSRMNESSRGASCSSSQNQLHC